MKLNSRGVTLVEIMASMLIFLVSFVATMNLIFSNKNMAKRAEYAYTAYHVAKNRVETLKSISFSDLSSSAETSTAVDGDGTADPDGNFRRTTTITTSYTGDANLTQAKVEVYYVLKGTQSPNPTEITTVIYNG